MERTRIISLLSVMSLATITAFQNCAGNSGVNFNSQAASHPSLNNLGDGSAASGSASGSSTGSASNPSNSASNPSSSAGTSSSGSVSNGSSSGSTSTSGSGDLSAPTTGAPNVCDVPLIAVNGACVCPGSGNFDGKSCVSCDASQVWDATSKACIARCAAPANFDGKSCVTCTADQAWDGHQCVTPSATCKSFQEVKSPFVIPSRDLGQTCYYVKLSKAYAFQTSSKWTQREAAVLSRDHDNYSNKNPTHPYIIGSSATDAGAISHVSFSLQGTREIILSGDTFGGKDVYVDNFILLKASVNGLETFFGEGTGDAPTYKLSGIANDNGSIIVDGQNMTNYYVGAAGGTANFTPVNLADPAKAFQLPLNTQINLTSEALDCGGSGGASDVYLLFR